MDLSVVIVNLNTKDILCQCLDSLNQVAKKFEMEIFVVDNGSMDGSGEIVRKRFPGVKLVENQMNLGFAKANNQALRLAKGKYVLLLNPDTQIKGGAIEEMILFMSAHPEVGVAGGQLLNSDGSKQNSIANFPSLATELLNKSLLRWLFPEKFPGKEKSYVGPIEVDSVIGACMTVRRDAMEQVGLLDEDYFLFMEETDWCYRMKKAGWKIYHIPQAEIFHFQGRSAEMKKERAKIEYYRSRYHFFRKNRGRFQWTILHIGLMIRLGVELIFASIAGIFTFFTIKKWGQKLSTYAYLVWWHLRFCPKGMGLKGINDQ
jgi:GT2 family glycosyltransferase